MTQAKMWKRRSQSLLEDGHNSRLGERCELYHSFFLHDERNPVKAVQISQIDVEADLFLKCIENLKWSPDLTFRDQGRPWAWISAWDTDHRF